ncbi:endonuclease MutS2 [Peredibacter starrii]|uniref:Smr/MutS family protein n=1 Tax=Peredibacter starrii TaxID=28202 RepID=A0AAX4HQB2_9BACT|nr:Smr/MutS family protein [Peredibacter starrii]WPU65515.1 Smr/MutS family protein [Peredibacter starrii]
MTINLITTQHSVHHAQVEWDVLSGIISQFAYFESNKKGLVTQLFANRWEDLSAELIRTQTYLQEFKDDYRPIVSQLFGKLPADESLDRHILHLAKEGVLHFSELNKVVLLIESAQFIKQDFPKFKIAEFQKITEMDFMPIQRKFLREFRHLVDSSGEVHFERHPELADLNRRLRELEDKIRKTVQEWINNAANQKVLQYNSYDVHYDRFVVPVRSDSYRSDLGLIVSRSESGQTLFVEPFEVRDACNRRLELIAKIDEIINQLAMKFSRLLGEHGDLINECLYVVRRIDFYLAKTDFATKYQLECPSIRSNPGFKFTGLFHPLIKNPVKNSADCHQSNHGIVISGPNTGGKTVFLKSVTLAYLLFYHGFFVPAAEAEMYPYEGVFYFGNDLQDLQVGLSSFSGEVKNYIDLMENILPSNLILIDEIFNSTSSDEASALSLSYFDELHKRAVCHIVVSTHHQMFKTLIHQDRNYISCHVGFDTTNMKPTYKIQWGTPGASMAIDIFRILSRGHDEVKDVPAKALSHLSAKNVSYETLLQKVSQKQIELDQILTSNRQLEVELKNQKGAMEGILNLRMKEELAKARQEVDKILNEARALVEEARRNEIQKVKRIDDKSYQLKTQIDKLRGIEVVEEEVPIGDLTIEEVKSGDTVYSHTLKKEFTVQGVDLRRREVTIAKGPIKLTVPVATLGRSKRAPLKPKVSVSFVKTSSSQLEFDVRGMRLSEFQNLIEKALGDLLSGDVPYISVIHGHGDGVLKNWLRDYLKRSRDFQGELPETGNDGETKIVLK